MIFIVMGFPTINQAQEVTHEIGIKTGINYFVWTNEFYTGLFKSQIRPNIGVEYQVNLMKRFSLKTSVNYQKNVFTQDYSPWSPMDGYEIDISTPYNSKLIYKNEHLFIPILANWSFGNKIKFFMNIGPSLNYEYNFTGEFDYNTNKEISGFGYTNFSLKYAFGFGFATPLGEKMVFKGELMGNIGFPNHSHGYNQVEGLNTMLLLGVNYKLPSS